MASKLAAGGVVQDRDEPGTGVLGIDVDGVRPQGAEENLGGPKSRSPLDANSARLEQLREHLGEEIRLAERFRRDDDWTLVADWCRLWTV